MKLYDLLKENPEEEITVWDEEFGIETYFYGGTIEDKGNDEWDTAMYQLAKKLEVINTAIKDNRTCAVVNLSQIIENNLDKLEKTDLFINCDVDSIMDDMPNILAGNVSEKWLTDFVEALPRNDERFYKDYILSEEEITSEGAERFCSVEIMYYNQCDTDDNYCGNLDECIKYCRDNGYILGIDAQIADIDCDNGTFDFCNDIYFEIPREIFDAYDKDEWDDEDVKAYAETLKDEDGLIDFDDVDPDEFLDFVQKRNKELDTSISEHDNAGVIEDDLEPEI